MVLLWPLLFIPLLGYAIAATRAAQQDPAQGPPPWSFNDRLIRDGAVVFWAIAISVLPFWLLVGHTPGPNQIDALRVPVSQITSFMESFVIAELIIALPWGVLALLWFPYATARYAATGRARDMFNVVASIRSVRRGFAPWNLVTAVIVTAWLIGVACAGLLCIGLVPGVYYAILVSAHASATLEKTRAEEAGETASRGPSAG